MFVYLHECGCSHTINLIQNVYGKHREICKTGRIYARHHECNGGRLPQGTAGRGRVWGKFGLLLSICGPGIPHPHGPGSRRTGRHVSGQAGRCVPLGRRSLRQKGRLPGHLAAMDREYHLVSHGTDLRRRGHRLYRHGPHGRHAAGLEPLLHPGRGLVYLLAGHLHLVERARLGRQGGQDRRSGGNHHPGGPAGRPGHRLSGYGWKVANGLLGKLPARLLQLRQPRAGSQYLPLLRRYGDGRYPCEGYQQPLEKLPQGGIHRLGHHGTHLCTGHLCPGYHHPAEGYQPHPEPAGGI